MSARIWRGGIVGQAVDDRYAAVLAKRSILACSKVRIITDVGHSADHPRTVFDGFGAAQLAVAPWSGAPRCRRFGTCQLLKLTGACAGLFKIMASVRSTRGWCFQTLELFLDERGARSRCRRIRRR